MDLSAGDINGGILVGMLLLSISMPASLGERPRSVAPYIAGALGAFVFFAVLVTLGLKPSAEGAPYRQMAVASLCFGVSLMALDRFLLKLAMACLLIPGGLFVTTQYNTLIATDDWTGNPEHITATNRAREEALVEKVRQELPDGGQLGAGQGWLLETRAAASLSEAFVAELNGFQRLENKAEWHSPISGLYRNTAKPMAVWYDGNGVFEVVPMDSRVEARPSSAPARGPGPLLGDKSPYQR